MMNAANAPTLMALLIGVYHISNSLSALRDPARWSRMANEMVRSPFNQLVGGFLALSLGFAVLVSTTWDGDWFSKLVFALGAVSCLKGVILLAFPEAVLAFSVRLVSGTSRIFAFSQASFGVVLTLLAWDRL